MNVTVDQLFKSLNLQFTGPIKWLRKIPADYNGVYVISLSDNPKKNSRGKQKFELCAETFKEWRKDAKDLEIDGKKVKSIRQVENYLEKFWHYTENIIYIGQSSSATNPLQKRINQFYIHKVGKKGPHTGGYWFKLLACHKDAYVYYAQVPNPLETEFKLLLKFVEIKSGKSVYEVKDIADYFPFANLKVDIPKVHTMKKYTNSNSKKDGM